MASWNNIQMPQVAGIGELLWDLLPEGRRIGGAPANFAYHVNELGVPATVVSCVGKDDLGKEIVNSIVGWKMDSRFVFELSDYRTGTVEVSLDVNGSPEYVINEEVAWDYLAWNDEITKLAASVRAVCFGTLGQRAPASRSFIQQFLRKTSPSCLRVFDVNLRQSYYDADVIRESLSLANVLKLNHEEAPVIARLLGFSANTEQALSEIRKGFDLDLIALTKGGEGSSLLTRERVSEHPGLPTRVVDTVGAGDAFTASLVVGLLRGDDLETLNADANRAAARVCGHSGAIPSRTPEIDAARMPKSE